VSVEDERQGDPAPAKRRNMLKNFEKSSMKTITEQSMSSQTSLGSVIKFARKFEHEPHWREVCFPTLDK
jgi:hypothetical protein